MTEETRIRQKIRRLISEYYSLSSKKHNSAASGGMIPLMVPTFGAEEVCDALDSLLDGQVTMGNKVKKFENLFADYIGVRHAIMVNSGSSANLLALAAVTNPFSKVRIMPGDEIVTPAVTWATTVWPIINCGAVPVLVDVDLDTFNIDAGEVKKAITNKTRAIMPVHLLGRPCDMGELMQIAEMHRLFIIEDCCEAHGAEFKGRKVGSFGNLSTFSFYFSHHISTIEGGMLLTNDEELAEMARMLRVFGWVRDLKDKEKLASTYSFIDPRFLFVNIGYNFRPMETQGAFGIHQVEKLDRFIEIRRQNAKFWEEHLARYEDYIQLHRESVGTKHVWFGYPITIRPDAPFTTKDIITFLESKGVETRPIMSGNIDEQPAMKTFPHRTVGDLPNSKLIMRNSFLVGNHHGIGEEKRRLLVEYINEFMSRVRELEP